MDLIIVDVALRGAATSLGIVTVILIWASRIAREAQLAYTLLQTTLISRSLLIIAPTLGLSEDAYPILRFLIAGSSFAMAWFSITIFLDDRRTQYLWLGSGLLIWIAILATLYYPIPHLPIRVFAGLLFVALLALVLWSGRDDLQDARRRLRPGIFVFLLVYCIGQAVTARPMQTVDVTGLQVVQAGVFLIFMGMFTLWSLKADVNQWPGKVEPRAPDAPTPAQVSSEQSILIRRIDAAMADGIWKVEGLTVGSLAQKVGAPEHQVRKAINQVLGHRNFASFINSARVEAAKQELADPDKFGKTVLEIAFEVGFSSLGPFNRAFRDSTGTSPTDFRKQALEQG